MKLDELIKVLNKRIEEVKFDLDREYKELEETLKLCGDSCYAAGFSRGSPYRLNDELVFLKRLIRNES